MFPDFAKTGLITWDDLHKRQPILDFSAFVDQTAPEFKPFVQGIIYHNNLDYTSHFEYKNEKPGYAYTNITTELFELARQALKIEDQRVRVSCHNLIEASVDYHLLKKTLGTVELIKQSSKEVNREKLTELISTYFKKDKETMAKGIDEFFEFVIGYDLRSFEEWVRLFVDLNKSYLNIVVSEEDTRKLLELSFGLTKDTWEEYLLTSISSFNNDVKDND